MATQLGIGSSVRIDGRGKAEILNIFMEEGVQHFTLGIEGIDVQVDLPRHRIEPIPETLTVTDENAQPISMETERFMAVDDGDIQDFISGQANKRTLSKTWCDLRIFAKYCQQQNVRENREIHQIPPADLNRLLSKFFISVRKSDGSQYEPSSLRGMMSSFDRQLKRHNYRYSLTSSPEFAQMREVLKSKQKQLKRDGKGNQPHKADPITDDEVEILWKTGQLGHSTPNSILQTLWFFNTVHFGLRGTSEHHDMRWGDISLCSDDTGREYLQFTERQTKTRTGENPRDVRTVKPKMWANIEMPDRCPVSVFKIFTEKRPSDFCGPCDPFYISAATKSLSPGPNDTWFLRQPVGVNKLSSMMKRMITSAGIQTDKNLSNHSARKHLVQKLNDSEIPANHIMQISGHKNIQSINNYSHISDDQHRKISRLLNSTAPTRPVAADLSRTAISGSNMHVTTAAASTSPCTSYSSVDFTEPSTCSQTNTSLRASQSQSTIHVFGVHTLFSGNVSGGQFHIHVHSDKLSGTPAGQSGDHV